MISKMQPLALLVAAAFGVSAQAAGQWASTQTLEHPVRTKAGQAVMAAEALSPAQSLHITVSLQLRNKGDLDARVARIKQGSTTDYLSPAQFKTMHSPSDTQAHAVADYMTRMGFRNVIIAPNNLLVSADGTSQQAALAFNTEIRTFSRDGERVYANVKPAQVPMALGGTVLSVHGLQNESLPHTMLVMASPATPAATSSPTGKAQGHQPTDFPAIYDAASLPPAANATAAIISWGDLTTVLSDLKAFEAKAGITPVDAQAVYVGTPTRTNGVDEWDLDSQDIVAAAGGQLKQLLFYSANGSLHEAYNRAVTDHLATAINVSLGECEIAAKQDGEEATDDQVFEAAVAQGQTFSVSTGDSGSAECGKTQNGQSYPAVSPYVMALGGTTVYTQGTTTYGSESTWSAGGGGPSVTEPVPAWQASSGVVGSSKFRGVPDISLDADPASGAIVIVNGKTNQIGGTSLSAPLFTGFWARIQSMNGGKLAFPDPAIYAAAAKNPAAFHDITTGSNGANAAAAGWDYATGWGTLDVAKFAALVGSSTGGGSGGSTGGGSGSSTGGGSGGSTGGGSGGSTGGGTGGTTPPAFNSAANYHTGDKVSYSGATYAITVDYKGALVSNYFIPGTLCAPAICTQTKPFQSSYSSGTPLLISFWTKQ